VERLFRVPAGAFSPAPRVDSAVIRLTPRPAPLVADSDIAAFRRLVVGLFSYRRKQIIRGLRELTGESVERVRPWLETAGIEEARRPQTLSPEEFSRLFSFLKSADVSV
jgi:16S rRNA (adenine1518-N6/adenine1519-N6)-dimethyltransferase